MSAHQPEMLPAAWRQAPGLTPETERALTARRRAAGILLGTALGISYGIVAQLINRVALPGLPLHQPPLGPPGNILLHGLVGAGLGFLSALPVSAAWGIFLGSLAAALAVFISTLLHLGSATNASGAFITSMVFSVPIAWLTVPVVALLRWAADRQVEAVREGAPLLARLRAPLVLMLIMAALAAFELLPDHARSELRHAHALVQTGLQASAPNDLPVPLRGPLVRGFPPGTRTRYSLEWTQLDLDRFIQLRPPSSYDQHAAVIVRFSGGYLLVCLYPTPRSEPNCGTY